ncbi:hypothetical protein [Aurantimonas endophytica]|uniref:Uncharacterized protein n=1 Tax=Aurantimonas endophytica TaxID=1522175 RepID=A0A7W6HBZ4_9HYPH|nr:hypothetical protein [Aurantimonas endophytica]MBB4002266.1 hypothetical protein [Aurantimonas endophytica]MCO6402108.1 hypothetical protein [Aurantimonas endophytica]
MSRSRADMPGRLELLIDRYYWLQQSRQQTARRDGQVLAATLAATLLFLVGPTLGVDAVGLAWFESAVLALAAAYVLATLGRRMRTLDCAARAERELEDAGYGVLGGVVHDRRGRVVERPSGLAFPFETPNPRAALLSRGTGI